MPYYKCVGEVPVKRHVLVEREEGYLSEELMGIDGFSGESALLYHRHSPSALLEISPVEIVTDATTPDTPLMPRHLRTTLIPPGGDPVTARRLLLSNDDVEISWVDASEASPLFRNTLGDELTYVQSGRARVETSFGSLEVGPGDYINVPMATTQRWIPDAGGIQALVLASVGHVSFPAKYLSKRGQFLEGAPFSERDLRSPSAPLSVPDEEIVVLVRNHGGWSSLLHAHHPFDVIGWDGCLYPYAFSIHDFEPLVGAIHQPPPVHQTFSGNQFVVCSFVPRPFDFWPGAIKVPYHHSNVDSDEVIFYSSGDFMSRKGSGIDARSISYHPAGFVHGPQPGSLEGARDKERTEEVAVMVDTFRPLRVSESARRISAEDYPWSWFGGRQGPDPRP
jgi:homogentisate 1,2-dioxygenase